MQTKRLFRSRQERMLGSVCGGLAEYLGLDPTVVRLVFLLLFFLGGQGLLVYLIMWLIVPEEPL
jgi:phage shock protein C